MTRLLLLPALLLIVILALTAALIRAQPLLPAAFTGLLPDAACAAPCFLGIEVGRTSAQQAIEVLARHPWVDHVILSERFGATRGGFVGWAWSGSQPAWINTDQTGSLWVRDNTVRFLRFQTTIAFGDLWLLLDRPARGAFRLERDFVAADPVAIHHAAWSDALLAQITARCPLRPADFWRRPAQVQYSIEPGADLLDYDLRAWFAAAEC
jgi:hypothetical protein